MINNRIFKSNEFNLVYVNNGNINNKVTEMKSNNI
jgi:hypothetical protein